MTANPACWLSVIMPTYNGSAYLAAALETVAAQAGDDVQVVAVDDGSTDGTLAMLRSCSRRLPITLIERPHGSGWVANTNIGLRSATGRWVCFLHQDDLWGPRRLETLRAWTARFPGAAAILHAARFVDEAGRRLGTWRCPLPAGRLLPGDAVVERLLVQNFVPIPAPIVLRDAVLAVGGLDEDLWYTADWDLWLKLAVVGPFVAHPEPLASFRVHTMSQTSERTADQAAMRRQLESVLARHLPSWAARHPGKPAVERAARFSIEVNLALAARSHGRPFDGVSLALAFARLGPAGWHRYVRDSRIVERVLARRRIRRTRPR